MSDESQSGGLNTDQLALLLFLLVIAASSVGLIMAKVDQAGAWLRAHHVLLPIGEGIVDLGPLGAVDLARIVIAAVILLVGSMGFTALRPRRRRDMPARPQQR